MHSPSSESQRRDTVSTASPAKRRDHSRCQDITEIEPWGPAAGTGPPRDGGHQGKKAIPRNFTLIYGVWHSWYRILPLSSLSQLSWICSSPHYIPAHLQNMGKWGTTSASLTVNVNNSEFLHSFIPYPKHLEVTGRNHELYAGCYLILKLNSKQRPLLATKKKTD